MCSSVSERNLLADTANIFEKIKLCKCKIDYIRKSVTEGLTALGYDASICKSRWEKAPTYPAGTGFNLYISKFWLNQSIFLMRMIYCNYMIMQVNMNISM